MMPTAPIVENCVTVVATAALVLGLYALGAGGWSAGGFLLLANLNLRVQPKPAASAEPTSEQIGAVQ